MQGTAGMVMSETAVNLEHVAKTFGDRRVVDDVSFSVKCGELFALIGPNGAGKTTTIRMIMDIIKPDSGNITILGKRPDDRVKELIGYLPEERGMYRKLSVIESITYLASLKGIDRQLAQREANRLLEEVGMYPHRNKKIEELSRGMGQLIQFLVTIVHDPRLIILDEPFSGLDPVNTERLKGLVLGLRDRGKAVIFSTHNMNEVEELCDRLLMINRGRVVLYGSLKEIKSGFPGNKIRIDMEGGPGDLAGVTRIEKQRDYYEMYLDEKTTPQEILEQLVGSRRVINRFEVAAPSLHEIFLRVAGEKNE